MPATRTWCWPDGARSAHRRALPVSHCCRQPARELTADHRISNVAEREAVVRRGGTVLMTQQGIQRVRRPSRALRLLTCAQVAWDRTNRVTRAREQLPFLNMARSLGDFWSFNAETGDYIVSPEPDVAVHDLTDDHFLILASDGIWDMLSPQDAAASVVEVRRVHAVSCRPKSSQNCDGDGALDQCVAKLIAREAAVLWRRKNAPADNMTVMVVFPAAAQLRCSACFRAPPPRLSVSTCSPPSPGSQATFVPNTAQFRALFAARAALVAVTVAQTG